MTENTEDIDIEAIEDAAFHQELSETVALLSAPTEEQQSRYDEKMRFLDSIHLEVFGAPKTLEDWEHDGRIDYTYVEPYQSNYSVNRSANYWQVRKR